MGYGDSLGGALIALVVFGIIIGVILMKGCEVITSYDVKIEKRIDK